MMRGGPINGVQDENSICYFVGSSKKYRLESVLDDSEEPINVFRPSFDVESCLSEIRECLEIGWTGLGYKTEQFENAWRDYTKLPHAHFISSNSVGLQLALKVFAESDNWNAGDEVITTPLTFISTNHAILLEGFTPVFADIDEYLCLDPRSIESKITNKTRAVMFVGIGGNSGQLEEVSKICAANGIRLILDAAHMAGSKLHNVHIGSEADCAVFSFQAVKNLPTGDSGMICFRDSRHDEMVRMFSWMGIDKDTYSRSNMAPKGAYKWQYDVKYLGLKANGNSIMASIGLAQLPHLEMENSLRRDIYLRYFNMLGNQKKLRFVPIHPSCTTSQHLVQVRIESPLRDKLVDHLMASKIYPGVHYRINTHYTMYSHSYGLSPNAERADEEIISLPVHMKLTDKEINRVGECIKDFLSSN